MVQLRTKEWAGWWRQRGSSTVYDSIVGRPIETHQARSRDARNGSRLALPPMGLGSSSTHGRGVSGVPQFCA